MFKTVNIIIIVTLITIILDCTKDSVNTPDPDTKDPVIEDTIPRLPEAELQEVCRDYFQLSNHCALGVLVYIEVPGYEKWRIPMGFFDDSKFRPLNTNDKFIIGSVSKTFTATIILQLMEEGLIDLDAPVINYLPIEGLGEEYDLNSITVRQLLKHESGIADFIDIPAFTNRMISDPTTPISMFDILSYVVQYRDPLFPPGTSFEYSSTNYYLLGKRKFVQKSDFKTPICIVTIPKKVKLLTGIMEH
jgi:hypothetical protein